MAACGMLNYLGNHVLGEYAIVLMFYHHIIDAYITLSFQQGPNNSQHLRGNKWKWHSSHVPYEPGQVFTLIWRPPWAQFGVLENTAKLG